MALVQLEKIKKLLQEDASFRSALQAANDERDFAKASKVLQAAGIVSVMVHDRNHPPGPELDEQGRPCDHACWYAFDGPLCICIRVGY